MSYKVVRLQLILSLGWRLIKHIVSLHCGWHLHKLASTDLDMRREGERINTFMGLWHTALVSANHVKVASVTHCIGENSSIIRLGKIIRLPISGKHHGV